MDREQADFVIEHGHGDYTDAELLEQAQANAQALVIATTKFLHQQQISLDAWTGAIGCIFAQGWDEPTVDSVELGEDRAEAVTRGFPDPDLCAVFDAEFAVAARFNDAPAPIARDRGLDWSWRIEGETIRLTAQRTDD